MARDRANWLLMEASERERRELERQARAMPRKYRHWEENLRRLKSRPPQDPQVGEAGIERAREALRVATTSHHQA